MGVPVFSAREPQCEGYRFVEGSISSRSRFAELGPFSDRMRLVFLLESHDGVAYFRDRTPCRDNRRRASRAISFKPRGMESLLCSETGGSFRWISVQFDRKAFASGPLAEVDERLLSRPYINFSNPKLWKLAVDLQSESDNPGELSALHCDCLMSMMLIEVLREAEPQRGRISRGGLTGAKLKRALEYIEESPLDRVRLSDLAAVTGLSVSHFSQAFRQSTGMAPYRWQLDVRVRKAQKLLLQGSMTLAMIAAATGFADQSHFTRVFRRFTGSTPGTWRLARRD